MPYRSCAINDKKVVTTSTWFRDSIWGG